MERVKYGMISVSSISPRFISAVRAADAGDIVAISSRSAERAREKAAEWGIPGAYGSIEELLSDTEVNTVYVSLVNSEHYNIAKMALEHGKNVVCEKPMTISFVQSKELFDIASKNDLFLMEAQKMLFLPAVNEVKGIISDGVIGDVLMVDMNHSFSAGYNNWLFDASLGGGTLLSSGIYAVHLMLWLFGDIKSIHGVKSSEKGMAEWQYIISGECEGNILFTVKNTTKSQLKNGAYIYGTKGSIELPDYWKARRAVVRVNGQKERVIDYPCEYELSYEAAHIADCLKKGLKESPVVTKELTLRGIELLESIK